MLKDLKDIISSEKITNLAIVIFGSPDPDALGSAYALSYMLKQLDVRSKIYIQNDISHPNNQMMVNQLDIPIFKLSEAKDIKYYGIVDYQFREIPGAVCILHIDHHKEIPSPALYQNIDMASGSTSTLMAQYLKELEIKDSKNLPKIALGLAYGVYTDTKSFLQASPMDFEAITFLRNHYDADAFTNLVQMKYSAQTMEVIKKALENNQVKGTFAYSGIGYISGEYRDSLAIAADFLLSQKGISNVLVYGIIDDRDVINGCFRTSDTGIDVDKFMNIFIHNGTAGGRKNAGGFEEPLGFFQGCKSKDKLWELVRLMIEERIKSKTNLTKAEALLEN